MITGHITDKGKVRVQNEDSFFVDEERNIYVVADGVGGQSAGEVASNIACSCISDYLISKHNGKKHNKRQIFDFHDRAIDLANMEILIKSETESQCRGMATTAVILTIENDTAYISNVGDSRAYLVRDGEIIRLTEDHTLANKLVQEGKLNPEDCDVLEKTEAIPQLFHTITRAVGSEAGVKADGFALPLLEGDVFLLCSDGLYGEVTDDEILTVITGAKTPNEACRKLAVRANKNGGRDNITAIIIENRNTDDEHSDR